MNCMKKEESWRKVRRKHEEIKEKALELLKGLELDVKSPFLVLF